MRSNLPLRSRLSPSNPWTVHLVKTSLSIIPIILIFFGLKTYGQCPATITVSPNDTVCQGTTITLTASVTAGTTFVWYRNGTSTGITTSPYIPTTSGAYWVHANTPCNLNSDTVHVLINPVPATPTINGSNSVCQNTTANYWVTSVTGHAYFWTVTGGGSIMTGQNTAIITVQWGPAGAGLVKVTDTIKSSGCFSSGTKNITINPPPTPVAFSSTNIGNICDGKFQFTTLTPPLPATGMTYKWNFGDPGSGAANNTSTLRNPIHRFNAYGNTNQNFTVKLIVTSGAGCKDSVSNVVNVKQRPNPGLLYDPPFIQCNPTPENFELTVTNNSSTIATNTNYEIRWGDASSPEFFGPGFTTASHTYTSTGSFNLICKVTGANGCSDSTIYLVFNGSNPALTVGNPGNTTGCTNGSACYVFPISGTSSNLSTTYHFDFGDGNSEDYTDATLPASVSHCYTQPSCSQPNAAFILTASATNPCATSTTTIGPIVISAPPIPSFTNPSTACITPAVTFTNTSQNNCYITGSLPSFRANYRWYVDGIMKQENLLATAPPPNFVYLFQTSGLHTVCLEGWNSCNSTDKDSVCHFICIDPQPVSSFTITPNSSCAPFEVTTVNNSTTDNPCNTLVYTWTVDNYTGSSSCPPNSSSWQFKTGSDLHSATPSFIFTNPGTYRINLQVTNSCGSVTSYQTVTVKVKPTVSLTAPASICEGASTCPGITWSTCWGNAPTYLWNFTGGTSPDPTVENACATYPAAGTFPITIAVTNECGTTISAPVSLVVKPLPVVTANNLSPVICSGAQTNITLTSTIAGSTFTWTYAPSSQVGGGSSCVSTTCGSTIAQTLTYTGTTSGTATYTITPRANNCDGLPIQVIVTINPNPTVLFSPASLAVCSGTATDIQLSSNVAGASFTWGTPVIAPPGSVTGAAPCNGACGTAIQQTLVNTTDDNSTVTYPVIATANSCAGNATNYSVTVYPKPNVSNAILIKDICSGTSAGIPLTSNVTSPPATFTWKASILVPPSGGMITGLSDCLASCGTTINESLTNTGTSDGVVIYKVVAHANGCFGDTTTFTVTVHPVPTVSPSETGQSICSGENSQPVLLTTTVPGTTFSWSGSAVAQITGYLTSGTGSPLHADSPLITSTLSTPGTISYTITPTYSGCPGTAQTHIITVNPAPTVTNSPMDQPVCSGDQSTTVILTSNVAGTSFTWTATPLGGITGYTPTGGNTIPSQLLLNPGNTNGTVTYHIIPTSGSSCPGVPADYIINVKPLPVMTFTSLINPLCSGQTEIINLSSTVNGTIYNWSASYPGNVVTGPSGATGVSADVPITAILNNGTFLAGTAVFAITPSASGCPGSTVSPAPVITVNPLPNVNFSIPSETICSGENITPMNLTSDVSGATYSFTAAPSSGSITGFTAAASNVTQIPADLITNSGTTIGTVTYSVIATANNCPGNDFSYVVTVNPIPHLATNPLSKDICSGEYTNINLTADVTGTTFSWTGANTIPTVNGITPGSSGSLINDQLTNPLLTPGEATYTIMPSFSGCPGPQAVYHVTVNPLPDVLFPPLLPNQTICSGDHILCRIFDFHRSGNHIFIHCIYKPSS